MRFAGAPRCVSPRRNYATRLLAARCAPGVSTCRDFDSQMRDWKINSSILTILFAEINAKLSKFYAFNLFFYDIAKFRVYGFTENRTILMRKKKKNIEKINARLCLIFGKNCTTSKSRCSNHKNKIILWEHRLKEWLNVGI